MTLSEYQEAVFKFALPQSRNITYMALGIANEAGEVAGKIKKFFRSDYDRAAARSAVVDELGDVLWYVAGLAEVMELDLSVIALRNIEKLQSRQDRGKLQGSGDNR